MNPKFRLISIWSFTIIYCLSISIVGSSFISSPLLNNGEKTTVSLFSKVVSDQHYIPAQFDVFSAKNTAFEIKDWQKRSKDVKAILLSDKRTEAVRWIQDQSNVVAYCLQLKKAALIFPQHYFW